MSILITASALEAQPWLTQTGLDINPVPADSYAATLRPGGVLMVCYTDITAYLSDAPIS